MFVDSLSSFIAADTSLSGIDGDAGDLIIRGISVEEIASSFSFTDLVHHFLQGVLIGLPAYADMKPAFGQARQAAFAVVGAIDDDLLTLPLTDALAGLLSRVPRGTPTETALNLIALPSVVVPALLRRRQGLMPLAPNPDADHATDILRMVSGAMPDPVQVAAFNTYLVTVCDHGLNASTFACRVVASTGAGAVAAVTAGLCALKGPLHGGAPGPVLDMLDAIGTPEEAAGWINATLARGERLMGFGHRVYRVRDPRANSLRHAVQRLAACGLIDNQRLALAEAVERAALDALRQHKPDRPLATNVEFYTALLLDALGFPRDAFTCVFAMGRVVGWIGHIGEQEAAHTLIRPQSRYIGPVPS